MSFWFAAYALVAFAIGFLFGWLAKSASLEEFTDYRFVSADCPYQGCHLDYHNGRQDICPLCGYDPNLPEGERETI